MVIVTFGRWLDGLRGVNFHEVDRVIEEVQQLRVAIFHRIVLGLDARFEVVMEGITSGNEGFDFGFGGAL